MERPADLRHRLAICTTRCVGPTPQIKETTLSKILAAQDQSALIKLASGLSPGSPERFASISGLTKQSGDMWIDYSISGVHISSNAKVYDHAYVSGNATVSGDAVVWGDAKVWGDAVILGDDWDGSEGKITSGRWKAPGVPA